LLTQNSYAKHLIEFGKQAYSASSVQKCYRTPISQCFNDIKSKHFANPLRDSSLCVSSFTCQPVAQELDKIHILHARKVCKPTSGSVF